MYFNSSLNSLRYKRNKPCFFLLIWGYIIVINAEFKILKRYISPGVSYNLNVSFGNESVTHRQNDRHTTRRKNWPKSTSLTVKALSHHFVNSIEFSIICRKIVPPILLLLLMSFYFLNLNISQFRGD